MTKRIRNTRNWLNGENPHPVCGFYVTEHGPDFACPPASYGGGPSKAEVAWQQYEIAVKALMEAEQQQRWKHNPYGHPDKNRRLVEAVERAQRRVDAAMADVELISGYEA